MGRISKFFSQIFSKKKQEEPEAPGWDAIDAALRPIYGQQEPRHVGVVIPYALGGPDPLQGISAYLVPGPPRHWHFVTYGFSDLFTKESEDPEISGWGFELTLRLRSDAEEPPIEIFALLQGLARYVFKTGRVYRVGDHVDIGRPHPDLNTRICALIITEDPLLRPTSSPFGRFDFRQVVGLTRDEYELVQTWNTLSFLELVRPGNPLLVTDLARGSYLEDPAFREAAKANREKEGSSTAATFVRHLAIRTDTAGIEIEIDQDAAAKLQLLLRSRSAMGFFDLLFAEGGVRFELGEPAGWRRDDSWAKITLGKGEAESLGAALVPLPGTHATSVLPFLRIVVVARPEEPASAGEELPA